MKWLVPSFVTILVLASQAHVQGKRIIDSDYVSSNSTRIVGGTVAEPGFAPYQVSLQNTYMKHSCGGAIVNSEWIITAGHCVESKAAHSILVVTGTNRWEEPGAIYQVAEIHMHCNYDQPSLHNDIALLKLNKSIVFDALTQPIALPTRPVDNNDEIILTGWGSDIPYYDPLENLQKLSLGFVPYKECLEMFDYSSGVGVGHVCTFSREGEGACHGDSGGPLISDGQLVGLVNWGRACAKGLPDVNANVYYYLDWVRSVLSANSRCTTSVASY